MPALGENLEHSVLERRQTDRAARRARLAAHEIDRHVTATQQRLVVDPGAAAQRRAGSRQQLRRTDQPFRPADNEPLPRSGNGARCLASEPDPEIATHDHHGEIGDEGRTDRNSETDVKPETPLQQDGQPTNSTSDGSTSQKMPRESEAT
jgi:hypothetical protein